MASCTEYLKQFWAARSIWFTALVLLLGLPIIYEIPDDEMPESAKRCLYILFVMALVWLTETLPISATALFPLVLFPLLGVMKASETAGMYITNTSMLFMGGLIVAVAVEEWKLHKRIAILVMMFVGSDPKWVMAGMMLPTWFLSMWISNTATASMMIPIAQAVLQQIKIARSRDSQYIVPSPEDDDENPSNGDVNPSNGNTKTDNGVLNPTYVHDTPGEKLDAMTVPERNTKSYKVTEEESTDVHVEEGGGTSDANYNRLCKGLTLCIAYAANIGGIATLTGTPPNIVLKGIADTIYNEAQKANGSEPKGCPISFANWMTLALPLSAITLILGWLLLVIFFLSGKGCCTTNKAQARAISNVVREEWRKLGKVTMAEVMVLILFVFLAVLWISRDPRESPGWGTWFRTGYVSDATSAMLVAVLLFILPAKVPNMFCFYKEERVDEPYWTPILVWDQVHRKLPWGVIILLGGGFALAQGVEVSELNVWLASKLQGLDHLDDWVLNLVLCLIVAAATEVTSNTATATLLMPILATLAISLGINPLYLMVSSALATSFAFMLPVATPPNAIVFSYRHLRVHDMAIVGFFMNIIAVGVLTLAVNTWGTPIYDFDTLDPIFKRS